MARRRDLQLSVPKRTRALLTFFDGTRKGLLAWLEARAKLDPVALGRELLSALGELNAFPMEPAKRFALLETLRSWVHSACAGAAHWHGTRPLMLDDAARGRAAVAQRLQFQLAIGYKEVIVDALRAGAKIAPGVPRDTQAGMATVAVHRTLAELANTLLRSLQCYVAPPIRLWEQLHELYVLAEVLRITEEVVHDDENRVRQDTRILDAYLRALLIASARPNMLRHGDLRLLFSLLEDWSRCVHIVPRHEVSTPLILVDLAVNAPPRASATFVESDAPDVRVIETSELVEQLEALRSDAGTARIATVGRERSELLRHALEVWGTQQGREFTRAEVEGDIAVCVGLASVHYHAGGRQGLLKQVRADSTEDDERSADLAPDLADPNRGSLADRLRYIVDPVDLTPEEPATEHPLFRAAIADYSPGGYGLCSTDTPPEGLLVGELLGMRKDGEPDWGIGVVRWIANRGAEGRFGCQLLAARGETAGARALSDRTRSGALWIPVILLPGSDALAQATTLLVPPDTFEPDTEIALNRRGREMRFVLGELLQKAEGFQLFKARELGGSGDEPGTRLELELVPLDD
ncbi:MAG: hypothetical protein V2J24_06280 [Pseudomonadales bacterium]|jgi:hypothetical protein|nr:hypothetical protein [Pseudomonadales bacterium]